MDIRLKDRLLGVLWKKVTDHMGEGNVRLSNKRGSLWALGDSGEVWDLFTAVVDCSDTPLSLSIVFHAENLDFLKISPGGCQEMD